MPSNQYKCYGTGLHFYAVRVLSARYHRLSSGGKQRRSELSQLGCWLKSGNYSHDYDSCERGGSHRCCFLEWNDGNCPQRDF